MKIIKEEVKEKALDYEKANIFKRFVAFIIDCILASIISVIPGLILALILPFSEYLIAGAYMLLRDGFSPQNRSIGKRVFNLKPIIVETGANCDFKTSAKRNWPFAIGFFLYAITSCYLLFENEWIFAKMLSNAWGIFILIEVVMIFTDKKGRTFGDKMAGTQVIELKKTKKGGGENKVENNAVSDDKVSEENIEKLRCIERLRPYKNESRENNATPDELWSKEDIEKLRH